MPSLVLYTLENTRSFAEKIRVFLAETGMKYDEQQIDQSTADEWTATGKLNFGILPALEADGILIENSAAILQYLAEVADAKKLGQGGNKYCGEVGEKPVINGLSLMVDRFQMEIKTFNGPDNRPANAEDVIAKWFGYFQERLERNDDNDVKTDEFLYGKVNRPAHLRFIQCSPKAISAAPDFCRYRSF
eukprot:TRINITY_DN12342_c0_g5_i3.p1 TRINITY_DN12342_c0_g5~~TRINITY_DN12342_c0_g5_i3.p1  ORF type:complete len:189 (+),score=39.84 TRINITY_DN12342_c0_g5_i3:333-899(+)